MEKTYLDYISELYSGVESDICMPDSDRENILRRITDLGWMLEKYSG